MDWASLYSQGMTDPEPIPNPEPLPPTDRLDWVRERRAAGANVGVWGEILDIFDTLDRARTAILDLYSRQQALVEAAKAALDSLETRATEGFIAVNATVAQNRTDAVSALTTLRNDTTAAITNEATARIAVRTDATAAINALGSRVTALETALNALSTQTTAAITADRSRLTALESAINNPTTGILKRLTAAGIP